MEKLQTAAHLKKGKGDPMTEISRRSFIKNAMVVGVAITAFPTVLIRRARASWTERTPVHPNVDNLRVVGITDSRMTKAIEPSISWARQEGLVIRDIVWENMDKLACALAQTRDAKGAWEAIFIKPPRKSWSETVVAIKTNNIGRQHTRSGVMSKVCHTLTDQMGVNPTNIHIYDGSHGSNLSRNTPFAGLPKGCRIEDKWGGIGTSTMVSGPWKYAGTKSECVKYLVDGTVDILINIAMCKGHSQRFGGFTMTMKNHFGTFSPMPGHRDGSLGYLFAINQTPEILGPMDKRTRKVLYPRQQLCLIDALWASKSGPGGNPSHQPNFLAMGVLSPVVDYQVATRFRRDRMGWQPNMGVTRQMLTSFGYDESDLPSGGKLIEAM
jgi:hypothetical protein